MAETMRLLPFNELLHRMIEEYRSYDAVFGIPKDRFYRKKNAGKRRSSKTNIKTISFGSEQAETPLGPAAGPHSQLSQNIIAAYLTGSRFIELKTVQKLDSLDIDKPCIEASDEAYNTEWSTELSLDQAWREYAKAWIVLHFLEELFELKFSQAKRSFIFNMSVGYDLEGIKTKKMDQFIDRMKDSSWEVPFTSWLETLENEIDHGLLHETDLSHRQSALKGISKRISGKICSTVTLSTMHGCPPEEVESICTYMISKKQLDTHVKLNPTLLGYDTVRDILDTLGYDYITFTRETFEHDLQYTDAVGILMRLIKLAQKEKRQFGIKLSNTLPAVNDKDTLPGDDFFMSGRALFPLTVNLAAKISNDFDGKLPISFCGGISVVNAADIFRTGIKPITMATDMLKPGGYLRMAQIASLLEGEPGWDAKAIDTHMLSELANQVLTEKYQNGYTTKEYRGTETPQVSKLLPLLDCAIAPCRTACPIGQDIPQYIQLVSQGRYTEAFRIITEKNALPHITGHICTHQCQQNCTRLDYEGSVAIRDMKKIAAHNGFKPFIEAVREPVHKRTSRCAVIGAGPAGLAAAYFLAREGFPVTVFEREQDAGGVVRNIVPEFRIPRMLIDKDIEHLTRLGVEFVFGADSDFSITDLKKDGYTYICIGVGNYQPRKLPLEGDNTNVLPGIRFLHEFNRNAANNKNSDSPKNSGRSNNSDMSANTDFLNIGKTVAVVGGGDTAMDTARAAFRVSGVEQVLVLYRRGLEQLPASAEEYKAAINEGIQFHLLRNPERFDKDGTITCRVMELGEPDASGRKRPVATDITETFYADTIIPAIGDKTETAILEKAGLSPTADKSFSTAKTLETEIENVFLIGDGRTGPSTIVNCISEGRTAADAICRKEDPAWERNETPPFDNSITRFSRIERKKGLILKPAACEQKNSAKKAAGSHQKTAETEAQRCLECDSVCNKCTEVCPNRANIAIPEPGAGFTDRYAIIHIDAYCNECGNCARFCPWDGKPYTDKPTVFSTEADFTESTAPGWYVDKERVNYRIYGKTGSVPLNAGKIRAIPALSENPVQSSRFFRLFETVYANRPSLFGPVKE